ncbi:serine protease [Lithospermum erythrorhizon]|uniref:S-formylglutathione hydrolase n=1 Tax=Lithospermum erythrorhizon TaxID=34254 RepID=A0AAV3NMH6_LITER
MDMKPSEMSSSKMFGGYNKRYKHYSPTLGCSMTFHIYFPPSTPNKFPILYFLSGLTCTDENFIAKSGAQRIASSVGIALVVPDTSPSISQIVVKTQYDDQEENDHTNSPLTTNCLPSFIVQAIQEEKSTHVFVLCSDMFSYIICAVAGGLNIEGEADSWDFGVGAGFYLNATQEKWKNWRMYDYVVKELPQLLRENFPQLETSHASISGHSMGGHGALMIYLKNLDKYKSVSAFSPIVNPVNCPWGQKAFSNYLGEDKAAWEEYDATHLVSKFNNVSATILIDQGEDDKFLKEQLLPHKFEEACRQVNAPLLLRIQPGYDHSYYFIASFIDDHIRHHAQALSLM